MSNSDRVKLRLASGGDERVSPKTLLYVRRATFDETRFEPSVEAVVVLPGVRLSVVSSSNDVATVFSEYIPIVTLAAPDGTLLFVNASAVADVDPPANRMGKAVLVFGVGPRAPRIGVNHNCESLAEIWEKAGLNPDNHGI
jgi:hypothetical protein